jgi:putative Holliday junction resolvase
VRILALDWGTVRIGAAISDPDGKIAFPLDKFIDSKNSIDEIKSIVEEKNVEKILLGIPKSLAGTDTESTKSARAFGEILSGLGIPIEYLDERLSSMGASKTLSELGVSQKEQRERVDNLASQQLLQTYLDTKSN